jgi:hypothetical protein
MGLRNTATTGSLKAIRLDVAVMRSPLLINGFWVLVGQALG